MIAQPENFIKVDEISTLIALMSEQVVPFREISHHGMLGRVVKLGLCIYKQEHRC